MSYGKEWFWWSEMEKAFCCCGVPVVAGPILATTCYLLGMSHFVATFNMSAALVCLMMLMPNCAMLVKPEKHIYRNISYWSQWVQLALLVIATVAVLIGIDHFKMAENMCGQESNRMFDFDGDQGCNEKALRIVLYAGCLCLVVFGLPAQLFLIASYKNHLSELEKKEDILPVKDTAINWGTAKSLIKADYDTTVDYSDVDSEVEVIVENEKSLWTPQAVV